MSVDFEHPGVVEGVEFLGAEVAEVEDEGAVLFLAPFYDARGAEEGDGGAFRQARHVGDGQRGAGAFELDDVEVVAFLRE